MKSLPAARVGDPDVTHCSQPFRAQGCRTVIVNGRKWSCVGHKNTPHLKPAGPKCITHAMPICMGSTTVFCEGRPAGRVTDPVAACTFVAKGSPNVYAGG